METQVFIKIISILSELEKYQRKNDDFKGL